MEKLGLPVSQLQNELEKIEAAKQTAKNENDFIRNFAATLEERFIFRFRRYHYHYTIITIYSDKRPVLINTGLFIALFYVYCYNNLSIKKLIRFK